jgi:hypothetical protein
MERSLRWTLVAAWCLGGLGCASGGDSGGDDATGRRSGNARSGPIGMAGTGSSAPVNPGGAFGNTDVTVPPSSGGTGAAGDGCVVGQFCAPTDPDPADCGSLTLEAEVEVIEHPGNVLLVFDTSASMMQDWNGTPRWEVVGDAIASALMPIADLLTVGSVFFPRADPNAPATCVDPTGITCIIVPWLVLPSGACGVTPITAPDQINFLLGPEFLTTFTGAANTAPPYAPVPGGFTPLSEGLQQAQTALTSATLTGITSVVVITDGDPNCEWNAAASRQIVTDWYAAGIKTYVLGAPGLTAMGETLLNDLAVAGGTGMYIPPSDPAALEAKLREIAMETVQAGFDSCEIVINPPAEVPDKLHLVVTENGVDLDVARELSADASWSISANGALVTLEGRLCDDATGGRFQRLRFEFGCVELPPLPPPVPVE